jgi:hypothetical protein
MTTPNYPQLATNFQQLAAQVQSLAQQFQDQGTGGSPQLVSITTAGPYTVNIPSGATSVDRVLCGAGGGAGGYGNGTEYNGTAGGETTASITGAPELTAPGGGGGTGSTTATTTSGASPGIETFNGANYTGGQGGAFGPGGAFGQTGAGQPGTAPGGGGGGGGGTFDAEYFGGSGGAAGSWNADTVTITSGMTEITGTVGAGGPGGTSANNVSPGGQGAAGGVFFYFHT